MKKLMFCLLLIAAFQSWAADATGPSLLTTNTWWMGRHETHTNDLASFPPEILFLGDSITDFWDNGLTGTPETQRGINVWTNHYVPRAAYNAGIAGDKIEDLRWRVENGLFVNTNNDPRVIVMMIGHNNGADPATNQVAGMRMIVDYILTQTPVTSEFLILGTFPSGNESVAYVHQETMDLLAAWPADDRITILNINSAFLNSSNGLNTALFADGTHPIEPGYQVWYEAMEPTLASLLGASLDGSTNALFIDEGSNATFTVRLDAQPQASTTVSVIRLSGDTDVTVSSSNSLVFTTNDWSSEQTVTVSAAPDTDWLDDTALIQCSSPGMSNWMVDVTVTDFDLNPNVQIPFTESFENNATHSGTLGDLDGQRSWVVSGNGAALVQNVTVHSGSQALSISNAAATHTFEGTPSEAWITLWADPVESELPPETIAPDAAAVFYINTNGQVVAYNSTTATELTGTIVSNGWNKFEIHCDYSSKVWNLFVNDAQVVTNFAFYGSPTAFSALELTEASRDFTAYADDIEIVDSQGEPDTDGDGLPDWWETQYFGGATNATPLATASNGVNSVEDAYIAGISPIDPDAAFVISDLSPLTSESILEWTTASGRVYSIYWTSNLLNGFGIPMHTNYSGGVFTDSTHSAEDKGFYKIEVEME